MEWTNPRVMTNGRQVRTRILVISMVDAEKRRGRFAERARNAGVSWSFYPAHTSLHPGLRYDERAAIVAKGRPLRAGELGVFSSHHAIWGDLQSDDADQYVILEDDVIVDWSFLAKLAQVDLSAIGVHYLRLYYKLPVRAAVVREDFIERARSIVELEHTAFGAQGYAITKAGAKTLLDHCGTVSRPIDDEMERTWRHGLPNLSVFPFPIMEESGPSTIGNTRFEAFVIPRDLRLRRFVMRRLERWGRNASTIARRLRRFRTRRRAGA
jgi:glycosyl transferase family 25